MSSLWGFSQLALCVKRHSGSDYFGFIFTEVNNTALLLWFVSFVVLFAVSERFILFRVTGNGRNPRWCLLRLMLPVPKAWRDFKSLSFLHLVSSFLFTVWFEEHPSSYLKGSPNNWFCLARDWKMWIFMCQTRHNGVCVCVVGGDLHVRVPNTSKGWEDLGWLVGF